jgi:hypothetical protein
MYRHAWRKREQLGLNEYERHDTITQTVMYSSYVLIGLASTVLALTLHGGWVSLGGWIYWLLGPVSGMIGWRRGVARERLHERSIAAPAQQELAPVPQDATAPL